MTPATVGIKQRNGPRKRPTNTAKNPYRKHNKRARATVRRRVFSNFVRKARQDRPSDWQEQVYQYRY